MDTIIIQDRIYEIRGKRVMFDFDLAEMYGIETRRLKEQVRRNLDRFPSDFMFELISEEWKELVTNCDRMIHSHPFSPLSTFFEFFNTSNNSLKLTVAYVLEWSDMAYGITRSSL